MDKLVIDASVAVKWFFSEPFSTEARRVLDGYTKGSFSFCAPDLINAELGNTIWKKQLFQGLLEEDAQQILEKFSKLPITFVPTSALLTDAYRLAVTHRRSVYDAMYLALSVRESCGLLTADERFVNAVSGSFPNIVSLANWQ